MVYVKPAMDGKLPARMKRKNGRKLNKADNQFRYIDLKDRGKLSRRRKNDKFGDGNENWFRNLKKIG